MSPRRGRAVDFHVDEARATSIGETLLDQFNNKKGFFDGYTHARMHTLPPNLEKGSREHALYLTYVTSIDYMVNPIKLWNKAREEYLAYPEHFQPETILSMGDRPLRTAMKRVGAWLPSTGASTWKAISRALLERYGGDPRRITENPSTIQEIKDRINELPYLRSHSYLKNDTLFNYYLRDMGENGLFKVTDLHGLDILVDAEVARFTVYTGVLGLDGGPFSGCVHDEPLWSLIAEAWRGAARNLGVYPWKLDEPMWRIGSRMCREKKCDVCPVYELCDRCFDVTFENTVASWG